MTAIQKMCMTPKKILLRLRSNISKKLLKK